MHAECVPKFDAAVLAARPSGVESFQRPDAAVDKVRD